MSDQIGVREAQMMMNGVEQRFRQLMDDRPKGWQRDYIELRRAIHDSVTTLGAAGRREFARHADMPAFEDSIARVRHSLLLHQAQWPVVNIEIDNRDFMASARHVADVFNALQALLERMAKTATA